MWLPRNVPIFFGWLLRSRLRFSRTSRMPTVIWVGRRSAIATGSEPARARVMAFSGSVSRSWSRPVPASAGGPISRMPRRTSGSRRRSARRSEAAAIRRRRRPRRRRPSARRRPRSSGCGRACRFSLRMMTPAPRKPMPVTMPCMTRLASPSPWPTAITISAEASPTRPERPHAGRLAVQIAVEAEQPRPPARRAQAVARLSACAALHGSISAAS